MSTFETTQDGITRRIGTSYLNRPSLYPDDGSMTKDTVVDRYFMHGLAPPEKFVTKDTPIVAFGSCFAANISRHLNARGYNVLTKKTSKAHVTQMGDGMVHTHAILQQFEWAWENNFPKAPLWEDYAAEEFGFTEEARLATKSLFDAAELFIITLGLSEIWYDEPTGEVFWRVPPRGKIDASRHKFRVASISETRANLDSIHRLIREYNPSAKIVFTVSPIALAASFRSISALSANAASKSILRAVLDEFLRDVSPNDAGIFYFPSYDVVKYAFNNQYLPDRRHVNEYVLGFNMTMFEHYYCSPGIEYEELAKAFRDAQGRDKHVAENGQATMAEFVENKEIKRAARIALRKKARLQRLAERKLAKKIARKARAALPDIAAE